MSVASVKLGSDGEEENIHIQELKKVFNSCLEGGKTQLDQSGLEALCSKLHLTEHSAYIIGAILPRDEDLVSFVTFKQKFILLLPEIVDLSSADDTSIRNAVAGDHKSPSPRRQKPSGTDGQTPLAAIENDRSPRRKLWKKEESHDDADTSHDILSDEFSESLMLPNTTGDLVSSPEKFRRDVVMISAEPNDSGRFQGTSGSISPLFLKRSQVFEGLGTGNYSVDIMDDNSQRFGQLSDIKQTIDELGLAQDGYLGRYELKVLCQHIGLVDLTTEQLNDLFHQLDKNGDGRVSLEEFFDGFPGSPLLTPRANEAISLQSDPSVVAPLSLNFFTGLSSDTSGNAKVSDLVAYWEDLGIGNARKILELLGFGSGPFVNVNELSHSLEHEMTECCMGSEVLIAALLTYKAELTHLRNSLEHSQSRSRHYLMQLQQMQSRNHLLVDELDQSQTNLEKNADDRVKMAEDNCRSELRSCELRFRSEREQWTQQTVELEELIKQLRENELLLSSRITKMERENTALSNELEELKEKLKGSSDTEKLSRSEGSLKRKLGTVAHHGKSYGASIVVENQIRLWRQKAECYLSENRILRDQLDELRMKIENLNRERLAHNCVDHSNVYTNRLSVNLSSNSLHSVVGGTAETSRLASAPRVLSRGPSLKVAHRTKPFMRKKEGKETSDFESDLEPMMFRIRIKRPLSKRQRREISAKRNQHERHSRTVGDSSTGSEEETRFRRDVHDSLKKLSDVKDVVLLEKKFADERKELEHHHKVQLSHMEDQFTIAIEADRRKSREQMDREKAVMNERFGREKREALLKQETELTEKFDSEKREMEIRWATERNVLERAFAEEKMEMMNRLQDDFEMELKRAKGSKNLPAPVYSASVSSLDSAGRENSISPVAQNSLERLEMENKRLQDDLTGMRNGYEYRLRSLEESLRVDKENSIKQLQVDLERLKTELEAERKFREDMTNWSKREHLPTGLRERFDALLDEFRVQCRNQYNTEKTEMVESFQRQRAQLMREMELEKEAFAASIEMEKEEMSKMFEVELSNTKEENAAELASMQRIIKQCQDDLQLKESSQGAVAGFLRSEIVRLETEAEALKDQLEILATECTSLRQQAEIQREHQQVAVSVEQLQNNLQSKEKEMQTANDQLDQLRAELNQKVLAVEQIFEEMDELRLENKKLSAYVQQYEEDLRMFAGQQSQLELKINVAEQQKLDTEAQLSVVKSKLRPPAQLSDATTTTEPLEELPTHSNRGQCGRCEDLKVRLQDLENSIFTGESGIEEESISDFLGPENPVELWKENRRLHSQLTTAQNKLFEIRKYLTSNESAVVPVGKSAVSRLQRQYNDSRQRSVSDVSAFRPAGPARRFAFEDVDKGLKVQLTYLEEENFLLKARLAQRENLASDQMQRLKDQLNASVQSNETLQRLYAENMELMQMVESQEKTIDMDVEEAEVAYEPLRLILRDFCLELAKGDHHEETTED